jgi:FkbM family methyltransferase
MISIIKKGIELVTTKGAVRAVLSWPIFSMASFQMISRAKLSGVDPQTIIDIGANKGQFSATAQRLFTNPTIFAVEPNPDIYDTLKRNLESDSNSKTNIISCAVSSEDGVVKFHINKDSQVSSLFDIGPDRKRFYPDSIVIKETLIPAYTLDTLFSTRELTEPILLKIDVQGAEHLVIEGAVKILRKVKWIILELSFNKLYEGEKNFLYFIDYMRQRGYEFIRPLNVHYSPATKEIIEMDALFENINHQNHATL